MSRCLLTAFSAVTGIPIDMVAARTNGIESEIIDPMAIGAARYRGLHPQELIDIGFYFGYCITEIEVTPCMVVQLTGQQGEDYTTFKVYGDAGARFDTYLKTFNGILLGTIPGHPVGHAVGWIDGKITDPTGVLKQGGKLVGESFLVVSKVQLKQQSPIVQV